MAKTSGEKIILFGNKILKIMYDGGPRYMTVLM